jgi:membrane protein YfhO
LAPNAPLRAALEAHPFHEAVRGALRREGFDPRRVALTTYPIPLPPGARPAPGESAVVTAASAHALSVHTRSAGGGLLVVSDPAYPGWQAFIDGQPTRLHEVYGVFRGVVIPPGEHDVAFRFHSRPFTVGLALSGFGLLAMGAAGVARAATVKSWSTREGKGASVTLLG